VSASCNQVELILLTGHSGNFVQRQLRHLPDNFDLSAIKTWHLFRDYFMVGSQKHPQNLSIYTCCYLLHAQSVHTESNVCKHVYPTPSKALGMSVSPQKLKVLATVSRQSVCESVIFGIPLLVLPTTCWKMDWDLLETNHDHFVSLCSELHHKDQVLVAQKVETSPDFQQHHQRSNRALSSAQRPCGYFILMPSENKYKSNMFLIMN
ncbi:meiosis 1 arrest protein-like, partial [Plakobranchus ocellatus]